MEERYVSGHRGGRGKTHLDEARMCAPSINNTPADTREKTGFALSVNVVKTAAGSTTAVLRVLCEGYRAFHAVLLETSRGLICQGMRVAECNVALVGRCCWVEFVEQRRHSFTLKFGPASDRRTAANVNILLFDTRRSSFGYQRC